LPCFRQELSAQLTAKEDRPSAGQGLEEDNARFAGYGKEHRRESNGESGSVPLLQIDGQKKSI